MANEVKGKQDSYYACVLEASNRISIVSVCWVGGRCIRSFLLDGLSWFVWKVDFVCRLDLE